MNRLTLKVLKDRLDYDPLTGDFSTKINVGRMRIGKKVGRINPNGYLYIGVKLHRYLAHRLAWFYIYGKWPDIEIDHINRNKLDNRISNLRDTTASLNQKNRNALSKNNQTGFLGVVKHNKGGYVARVKNNNKSIHIKHCATAEEASKAYLNYKQQMGWLP